MKKLAFMIVPLKAEEYLFQFILDKIYVEFAGCTYYEVKGMWSGNHRDDQTIPCIKIEIAMDLKKTEEFLKIASYALKNIKCQELMVQLPSGEIKFLKDKVVNNQEYLLVGGKGSKSVANGYAWSECKIQGAE